MPAIFSIIILGIIQGLTEFLPVSSSGHLVLFSNLFGVSESLFVSVILHMATLLSVVVVLRKQIIYYLKHPLCDGVKKLVVASVPTCLIVLVLLPVIEKSFGGAFLPFCFMTSAFLLAFTDLFFARRKSKSMYAEIKDENFSGISYLQAFYMGIAQGFAVFPGISRSGSTICAGMLSGGDKSSVAEFSFLMSLPIIFLSLFKEIYDLSTTDAKLQIDIVPLILAFIFAFIIGMLAIKFMIRLTKKVNFLWFSLYLIVIAFVSFMVI